MDRASFVLLDCLSTFACAIQYMYKELAFDVNVVFYSVHEFAITSGDNINSTIGFPISWK